MTNFEKWKEVITIEHASSLFFEIIADICDHCPNVYFCEDYPQAYRPSCEDAFLKWANKEAT